MSQFKIPLIVFIVVFLLSGMLAFLGGASYLGMVFKAFVSALVAIVFVFLARFLLERYTPDLFENGDVASEADFPTVGTNVNVQIGGDEASFVNIATSEQKENAGADVALMEGLSDDVVVQEDPLKDVEMEAPDFKPINFKVSQGDQAFVGGTETPLQDAKMTATLEKKTQIELEEGCDLLTKKDEVTSTSSASSNEGALPKNERDDEGSHQEGMTEVMENDVDRLEELPDLQEFVDSSAILKQSKAEELMSGGTQSFFETNLSEDVGTDSKLMANAIRTVLRRE